MLKIINSIYLRAPSNIPRITHIYMLQDLTVTISTDVLYCCSSTTDTQYMHVRSVVIIICAEFLVVPLVELHRIGI